MTEAKKDEKDWEKFYEANKDKKEFKEDVDEVLADEFEGTDKRNPYLLRQIGMVDGGRTAWEFGRGVPETGVREDDEVDVFLTPATADGVPQSRSDVAAYALYRKKGGDGTFNRPVGDGFENPTAVEVAKADAEAARAAKKADEEDDS